MKKITITLIMFFASIALTFGQNQEATTNDGKKVILKNDGTWEYTVKEEKVEKTTSDVDLSDCKYWKNEVDEFTGDVKKYTKSQKIGKSKYSFLNMELRRFNDSYLIYARYTGDLGCVSSDSYIMIKLKNGETIKLINFGDIDCGDNAPMYFYLSKENFKKLLQSPVDKIRVRGTKYYSDIDMLKPNFFIDYLKCIKIKGANNIYKK